METFLWKHYSVARVSLAFLVLPNFLVCFYLVDRACSIENPRSGLYIHCSAHARVAREEVVLERESCS